LRGLLWNQEEIVAVVAFAVLHEAAVEHGTWHGILNARVSRLDEHSLVDSLIDHDQRDLWRAQLVVDAFEDRL